MRKHRIMGQAGTQGRRFVIAAALMALAAMGLASSAAGVARRGGRRGWRGVRRGGGGADRVSGRWRGLERGGGAAVGGEARRGRRGWGERGGLSVAA
jgi:hypothetical protein